MVTGTLSPPRVRGLLSPVDEMSMYTVDSRAKKFHVKRICVHSRVMSTDMSQSSTIGLRLLMLREDLGMSTRAFAEAVKKERAERPT